MAKFIQIAYGESQYDQWSSQNLLALDDKGNIYQINMFNGMGNLDGEWHKLPPHPEEGNKSEEE